MCYTKVSLKVFVFRGFLKVEQFWFEIPREICMTWFFFFFFVLEKWTLEYWGSSLKNYVVKVKFTFPHISRCHLMAMEVLLLPVVLLIQTILSGWTWSQIQNPGASDGKLIYYRNRSLMNLVMTTRNLEITEAFGLNNNSGMRL